MSSHKRTLRRILLLSVRPRFAAKILDGTKRVELRRICPKIGPGDIVLFYVSSPDKALRALASVQRIRSDTPLELWAQVKSDAGVTEREFMRYYEGAQLGYGIHIGEVTALREPITLDGLRRIWPGFTPPQVFRYVSDQEFASLVRLTGGIEGEYSQTVGES